MDGGYMIPMQDTSGFYRINGNKLEHMKDIVTSEFQLYREKASCYVYPVDGWYFFWSHEEAVAYFSKGSKV
jgi:hypothetical protein